ncbi:MAG: hypothetical protein HQ539_00050 [Parcubacteria group bacterium]|nr:hypothetical protein [Parcubacteria group bacterium]
MKKKKEWKDRKDSPPQTKTLGLLRMLSCLSHGTILFGWIKDTLDISERAVYRYVRTMRKYGLTIFTSSNDKEDGGKETSYSFWPHTKKMVKVTIEWDDGSKEGHLPDELAILPVKKYSHAELEAIKKAKKKAKSQKEKMG